MIPDPKTWYLGPEGDLRALPTPEPGLSTSTMRYGGIHQGLSGARTLDVTGHRAEYQLDWRTLDAGELAWIYALHTRQVPGPHWLINPMIRNRLSIRASSLDYLHRTDIGVSVTAGQLAYTRDWPPEPAPGVQALRWLGRGDAGGVLRFDTDARTPILEQETITASLYAKATTVATVELTIDFYAHGNPVGNSEPLAVQLGTEWARHTTTVTTTAGTTSIVLAVTAPPEPEITIAAPQLETGPTATAWQLGGGAPRVLIDQLDTTSPRYPFIDCQLTLLEA